MLIIFVEIESETLRRFCGENDDEQLARNILSKKEDYKRKRDTKWWKMKVKMMMIVRILFRDMILV
jgi:hypothetical protein